MVATADLAKETQQTTFSYTVTPPLVPCSDTSVQPPRWSVVSLTVTITNETDRFVECARLVFTAAVGDGETALTPDPDAMRGEPGPRTPWFVGGTAERWVVMPLPPTTGLAAGERVELVLDGVLIGPLLGDAGIRVEEETDRVRTRHLTVKKEGKVAHGDVPYIRTFTAQPAEVAQGGFARLSWSVLGAESAEVLPGPIPVADPRDGRLAVRLERTTMFRIRASGTGGVAEAEATVVVMPVVIESFEGGPERSAGPRTPLRLHWSTKFASHCAIDHGVGPVPMKGSVEVTPDRTTVYTLTAYGLRPQSASVTVVVPRPEPGR